jgi:Flp pilus assembly protein TadD
VIARLRALHTRAPDSLAANGAEWELVHIARGMLLLGRARDAGELLAFAAEVFPRSASVAAARGRALEALGDRAGARAAADRALALDPYDPAALELRRRLTGAFDAPPAPVRIR